MEIIVPCCAGLDVHKDSVEACVRRMEAEGKLYHQIRHWGTATRELMAMADWFKAEGVTQVAMESTGVYWKPIFNILEGEFEVLLVNAQKLKHVPGHKTDVQDCQWIAQLLQHGLLKESFIPPRWQRELRDLTRQRAQVIGEHSRISNRIQKVLEDANIKLGSVASDVVGVSGRQMLQAIIGGESDPARWPIWPGAVCGERFRSCRKPCTARSASTIAGCWPCCGTHWRRRKPLLPGNRVSRRITKQKWLHFWSHDAKRRSVGDVRKGDARRRSASGNGSSGIVENSGRE